MASSELRMTWTDPNAYQLFMGRWSELLASPFIAVADVQRSGRILDVGCGTGVLSKALALAGAEVVGLDASEGYLEGARSARSHPRITYEAGDMRRMRFADGAFEAAVSTLALDVIPETDAVVAEMKRVTRPGGVVASAVHQFYGGMPAFDLVLHTAAVLEPGFAALRNLRAGREQFWPDGQAALWRRAGLIDVSERPVVVDCEYPSFADYWATFIGGQGSISGTMTALPQERRTVIEAHVREGYLAGLPDGPRSFPMMFRVVRGIVPA